MNSPIIGELIDESRMRKFVTDFEKKEKVESIKYKAFQRGDVCTFDWIEFVKTGEIERQFPKPTATFRLAENEDLIGFYGALADKKNAMLLEFKNFGFIVKVNK
mmetsp:Transcript_38674/g.50686  ORF Transcript_38674/g.50686 Transcript_38674/m.50686 type:complete len:104 (+) Transcript_38674:679-990(+)